MEELQVSMRRAKRRRAGDPRGLAFAMRGIKRTQGHGENSSPMRSSGGGGRRRSWDNTKVADKGLYERVMPNTVTLTLTDWNAYMPLLFACCR